MTQRKDDSRYQFQPWPIRVWRWCRYKPLYTAGAILHVCLWLIDGRPTEDLGRRYKTRRARAWGIWTEWMSMASYEMGHYYLIDEMIDDLRKDIDAQAD